MKELGGAGLSRPADRLAARRCIGARDFAAQIYDLALLRALVGVGRDMVEGALDTSEEVAPLSQIERAESELYRVAERAAGEGTVKSFGEATRMALEQAEKALNSGGHLSGITTGLDGDQRQVGGLHKSDLVILAGRPGMGKTSLATNIAFSRRPALRPRPGRRDRPGQESAGAPVAFFSLEMSADQLATRILAEQSGISSENLRMGKISQQEFRIAGPRGGRAAEPAALHRRHAGPDHRRAAHPRSPPEAAEGHRPDRGRLSPAAPGHRQGRATTIASRKSPRSAAA